MAITDIIDFDESISCYDKPVYLRLRSHDAAHFENNENVTDKPPVHTAYSLQEDFENGIF